MKKTVKSYLDSLKSGNYQEVMNHFNKGAIVFSPLYGKMPAKAFYKELFSDTGQSKIRLFDIYVNKKRRKASCHFQYEWRLTNGKQTSFECVDLFEFGENGKVDVLKIIYDTSETRKVFRSTP